MQLDGEHAIDMGFLYVIRISSSYSQLGRVMHFLQNFLTLSIVLLTLLPIGVAKVVIDILCAALGDGTPVHYQRDIQEYVTAECQSPWRAAQCGGCRDLHGMHRSRQSLINNFSSLC